MAAVYSSGQKKTNRYRKKFKKKKNCRSYMTYLNAENIFIKNSVYCKIKVDTRK